MLGKETVEEMNRYVSVTNDPTSVCVALEGLLGIDRMIPVKEVEFNQEGSPMFSYFGMHPFLIFILLLCSGDGS